MNIGIVGTGYVGLVSGTCFSEMGINVTCIDIDKKKIEGLNNGVVPIYEPGLEALVKKNVADGRLHFTTSLPDCIADQDAVFIAVGTPPGEDQERAVGDVAPRLGLEPRTCRLTAGCSAIELPRNTGWARHGGAGRLAWQPPAGRTLMILISA